MKVYVLIQVKEELHETEGCECGCEEGWESNYETHCSVIKVSTNLKKLEDIKLAADNHNEEVTEYNKIVSDEYTKLINAENARISGLYTEQLVKYKKLFEEYKNTVNKGLHLVGKELYPRKHEYKPGEENWFARGYCKAVYMNEYLSYQHEIIFAEFFKRFPDLKLNDKHVLDLTEKDLPGYQNFEKKDD
jgi:hypothetical protein